MACTVAMVALSVRSAAARSYARPMLALVAILAASANGGHTGSGARRVMVAYVKHSGEFCSGGTEMYAGAKDTLGACQALCTDQGCLCFDYEEGSHRCRLKGEFASSTLQTLIVKKQHPLATRCWRMLPLQARTSMRILFSPLTRLLQGAHFPSRQATLGLTHIPFRAVPVPPHHHHHHHPGPRRPPAQQFGLSSGWGTSRCRGARRQMCLSARWLAVVKSMPVLCLQMPAQKRLRVYQGCLADRLPRWLCHHCRTHSSCDRRRPAHRGSKGQDRCKMMPSQSLTARVETKA